MKLVIFTDLDGTLLDDSYSFAPALPALEILRMKGIPWVICSSKTRPEIEYYRTRLSNTDPYTVENGGAVYIPKGYFYHMGTGLGYASSTSEYVVINLGERYECLRKELLRLRVKGFSVKGFGDMTAKEVSRFTGLNHREAELAKQREFDEPFVFEGSEKEFKSLVDLVRQDGFFCLEGGALHHLAGANDKGKAISVLIDLYRRKFRKIVTVALGDGPNDIPMLQTVDYPVVVQKTDGSIDARMKGFGFAESDAPGPIGWNEAVLQVIEKMSV